MKKKWVSLLLALALCLGLAAPAMAAEAAPQTKAYTCDKILWLGPIPVAGMTVINGEYYVPLEVLKNTGRQCVLPILFRYTGDDSYCIEQNWTSHAVHAVKPVMCTIPGLELGTVTPSASAVKVVDKRTAPSREVTLPAASVYDLGGRYPMVRLRELEPYFGYREDDAGIHICELLQENEKYPAVTWEDDLAGQAAKPLRVKDTRAALQAFHNCIVNTLSHEDFIDNSYFQKNDPQRHQRIEQMGQKYEVVNNAKLAARWGVCQNYAEIFQAMCLQAGIPCELVFGEVPGGSHAWNRVWLWGQWYHIDATFDDPGPTPTLRQTYFLVPADKMMNSHVWLDTDYNFPDRYDPSWAQIDPKNLTTAEQYRKCLVAQLVQGKTNFSLRPATAAAYGGSSGPVVWALMHADIPSWSLRWSSKYNSATKSYDFTVIYDPV
ncbi:MAG: hypothetical protein HFF87_08740 [Oscillibacter sp.]|jgi:hypothetical protein|nr:hypothetical protein [Oscillibacter sp.]